MSTHLPELTQFCAKLAKLHASTYSPAGKFGYHVARDMAKRKRQIQINTCGILGCRNRLTNSTIAIAYTAFHITSATLYTGQARMSEISMLESMSSRISIADRM